MSVIPKPPSPLAVPSAGGALPRPLLAYAAFAAAYFFLAAYAATLHLNSNVPPFLWPAHGLALGTLLMAPQRRWPVYLALVIAATVAVGLAASESWGAILRTCVIDVAEPAFVALGLKRLAGPRVQIETVRGLAALLVGMLPLVAITAVPDAYFSNIAFEAPFQQRWSVVFVSTMLGMLLTAPLLLAWSRQDDLAEAEIPRQRLPEVIALFVALAFTTHYVFSTRPPGSGYIPPLAYLTAPFLIWAALRFGMRTATVALALFGLLCYWHTGRDFVTVAATGAPDIRSLLYLQGYLATVVITTLFSAALLVERQHSARETEEWRYRHERVIRASGSLLYDLDPQRGTLVWDGDTEAVLGTTRAQLTSVRQWMSRVHPDDRNRLKGLRENLLKGQVSHVSIEYRFRRDDGEYITIGVNAYRIADARMPGGRRVIGFVRDVTDKVRAEAERLRLEAQLKQAEKMQAVGHLAGGIAHDFNNILGAILGYGELAQARAAADESMKRYLDTIMNAGNRAKSLVNQILSYSRAEGSPRTLVVVPAIVEEVVDLVRGSRPVAVDVKYVAESHEAAVMGDATRLHQLIMNLASNAVHAMGQGGVLEVVVSAIKLDRPQKVRSGEVPSGEFVRIVVKDSGHGIAPEVIDRIFEPFFTTKPAGRGTGLGLALVHSVVTEHSGFIDVESELGRGTTFTVWIPRAWEEGDARPADEEMVPGRGQVILCVDDEPEVLAALEEMLATLGYEPAGYRDSREALEALRADPGHYEALVSDEVMPGLTGTQFAIEARKLNPALPILIASGYGGAGFETRALSAGVDRVLKKPYRMGDIAEVLGGFFASKAEAPR